MNFLKKINSKRTLSVLDFGSRSVRVLIGEKKEDQSFRILGAGESDAQGVENGQIVYLGDAVESVVEAVRKAEASSGLAIRTLYYNFDDARMESVRSTGSVSLQGEGEIRPSDVRRACAAAARLVEDFQKNIVYAKELNFLIDDRDELFEPLGVFAGKLEVRMHFLLTRAEQHELWQSLMERSGIRHGVPVLSAWSTAYAILPRGERRERRLILDLGRDFLNIFIFGNNMISDHRIFLTHQFQGSSEALSALIEEFGRGGPPVQEALVTGDLAEDQTFLALVEKSFPLPLRRRSPQGVEPLSQSSSASLVGLLPVADELEGKPSFLSRDKSLWGAARDKAASLINEYF